MARDQEKVLQQAIEFAEAGRKDDARKLLLRIISEDEQNEGAWLWLSQVVDSDEDKRICLENVISINPKNEQARLGLDWLMQQAGLTSEDGIICPTCGLKSPVGSIRCLNCYTSFVDILPEEVARQEQEQKKKEEAKKPKGAEETAAGALSMPTEILPKTTTGMFNTWAAIFPMPPSDLFAQELTYAAWRPAIKGVVMAGLVSAVMSAIAGFGSGVVGVTGVGGLVALLGTGVCGKGAGSLVMTLVWYLVVTLVFFLFTRIRRLGLGLSMAAYLSSIIYCPLNITASVLEPLIVSINLLMPIACCGTWVVGLVLILYGAVLYFRLLGGLSGKPKSG